MEATTCGGAIVVVVCLVTRDYAIDGVNYLAAPPKDPDVLAKAIVRALAGGTLSAELRINGLGTMVSWANEWMGSIFLAILNARMQSPFTNGLSHGLARVDSSMSRIKYIPKKMRDDGADCALSLTPVKEPQRYGIVEPSEDWKKVIRTVETPEKPRSNLAAIGLYAFNSSFFEVYPRLKPS